MDADDGLMLALGVAMTIVWSFLALFAAGIVYRGMIRMRRRRILMQRAIAEATAIRRN